MDGIRIKNLPSASLMLDEHFDEMTIPVDFEQQTMHIKGDEWKKAMNVFLSAPTNSIDLSIMRDNKTGKFKCVINTASVVESIIDNAKYRFVLMRFRKHKHEGRRWRIPMLPYIAQLEQPTRNVVNNIAYEDTWWTITGSHTEWWNGLKGINDVLRLTLGPRGFANVRNKKMLIGVAIFYNGGGSNSRWVRISNIAKLEMYTTIKGIFYNII